MIQAISLGLIQGLSEFWPISSSGHLIIARDVLGWADQGVLFDAALGLGTAVALLAAFWGDWVKLIKGGFSKSKSEDKTLFWMIILASIPAGIAGLYLKGDTERLMRQPLTVAFNLAAFGLLLGLSERLASAKRLTWMKSFLIGLSQILALSPGVSRSGITMTAGMNSGLSKVEATRFAFLLAMPITLAAGVLGLLDVRAMPSGEFGQAIIGALVAAISGYLAVRWLLNFVKKHSIWWFVWYRLALATFLVWRFR